MTMASENIEEYAEYNIRFMHQLGDVVSDALDILPMMGHIQSSAIYPIKMQLNAAQVGFDMGLPVEIAIVLYVYIEAWKVEQSTSFLGRALPGKNKNTYRSHVAIAKFVEHIFINYKDTKIFPEYLDRLLKEMKQKR